MSTVRYRLSGGDRRTAPGLHIAGLINRIDRTVKNFKAHVFHVAVAQLNNLVKPFGANTPPHLLEKLVLLFDDLSPHWVRTGAVTLQAFLQRDIK